MQERDFIPELQSIDIDLDFSPEKTVSHFPTDCGKASNHTLYKPLTSLTVSDLPPVWRHDWALKDLQLIGRRVVHLSVLRTSTLRRDWREKPSHEGSGFLTFHPKHGPVVHTSKHVVLNPFEAEHTIVRLFFDDDTGTHEMPYAIRWFREHLLAQPPSDSRGPPHLPARGPSPPRLIQQRTSRSPPALPPPPPSTPVDRRDMYWESPEHELYLYLADERYFKSVMCSDYTSFAVDWRVQAHFTREEIVRSDRAFSWRMAGLKRLVLGPQVNIDVGVVSHPHGMPKRVAFGKMKRLTSLHPALYDAPTCGGSSGSPVVRLHPDSMHYISAGQFVHHGHYKRKLDLGMGTVRPPVAFPYIYKLDVETVWTNALSVCYEPIFYWTLFACDLLHIESTLVSSLDVFAYTSTLSAFAVGVSSRPFQVLFTGYWLHVLLTFLLRAFGLGWGPVRAAAHAVSTFISMSMFLVSWALLLGAPYPLSNVLVVSAVWLLVLFTERHYDVHGRFLNWAMGSYADFMHFSLAREEARLGKRERRNMDTVEHRKY